MKWILFIFLLSVSYQANASESDKLCTYIEERSSANPKLKKAAMEDLANIANVLMEIPKLQKSALDQKMTFKMFQQLVQSEKKIDVPNSYEAAYNSAYLKQYCGSSKTEAGTVIVNGKTLLDETAKVYQNQFDPQGHKYYQDLPNRGRK